MKLTKAQYLALVDFSEFKLRPWATPHQLRLSITPIKKLRQLGLLEASRSFDGRLVSYRITDAGRNALEDAK